MQTERFAHTISARSIAVLSATSMGAEPRVREMLRPRTPNYLLRRLVAGVVASISVLTFAAGSIGLLASFGSAPASASEAQPALSPAHLPMLSTVSSLAVHIAQPGDTLWSIARQYRGDVSHHRYVDALVSLNNSTLVQVGQAIWLP